MANNIGSLEYVLPNNAQESERLDFQHLLLTRTFGGLHRAPLDPTKIKRILDIGCGTGNWAIDFAKQFPKTEVVGFDLQEKGNWATAPANCTFKVADLEHEDTWSSLGQFDFIHGRFIVIGVRDWPDLLRKSLAHLSPGGSLEIQELCMPCKSDDKQDEAKSKFIDWSNRMIAASGQLKLNLQITNELPNLIKEAGFEDANAEEFRMFTSPWAEDDESRALGRMGQQNLTQGMHGFGETLFTKILGWSAEEHDKFVESIVRELQEDGLRTWLPVKVCFARKKI